jgi:hypothetical protein
LAVKHATHTEGRVRLLLLPLSALQDENIPIIAKFVPGGTISRSDAETIAPMGNSPTFLSMKQMREVVPLWQNMSVAIFKDKEANEVREACQLMLLMLHFRLCT